MGWSKIGSLLFGGMALLFMGCGPLGKPVDPAVSPSYFYGKAGRGVVYSSQGNWLKLGHKPVEGADRETFQPLGPSVAVDKHQVYFRHNPQPHIDRETFEYVDRVMRDKDHVYVSRYREELLAAVEGVDVASFRYLFPEDVNPSMWARDANRYYINHEPIAVDVESFEFLNYGFVADRYLIYRRDSNLRVVAAVTGPIEVVNRFHLRMGNQILSGGTWASRVLDFDEIHELREVGEYVMVINGEVYDRGTVVPGVDAASLELWPDNRTYARDAENVFFIFTKMVKIEGADRESFAPMERVGSYARDANRVYYGFKVLEDADLETFEVIPENKRYDARDQHGYFRMGFRQRF